MNIFTITDHADQQFGTIINGVRVTLRLRYNPTNDRWSFDLSLDDLPVLHGRRIVTGIDLLAPFDFGLGVMFAAAVKPGVVPDRNALPEGTVRFYQASQDEVDAAISS